MRSSVERLRIGLLVGAGLLILVIAAFLGYARYKVGKALVDLPGKLGATITKEFNGYTYSQSDGKRTIFTIHAAKAVQYKDGTYSLHDVNMVLYGKKGDRADRISGDDFEYDTKAEIIKAAGIVHLDLQAPEAEGASTEASKLLARTSESHDDAVIGSHVIHVKTSGLVYVKKLGIAATKEGIEFAFNGFTGHAIGAEYNSDTGHLVLQSAIAVNGIDQNGQDKGHPVALSASHGELDRTSEVAVFEDSRYTSRSQRAHADVARVHMRTDGTVERVEGERHVLLEDAGQGNVSSDRADVSLDSKSKPKAALFAGNVHFIRDEPLREVHGDSDRANLEFDVEGGLDHAVLEGRVHASERSRVGPEASRTESQRDLNAQMLELSLVAGDPMTKPQLSDVRATGSAHITFSAPDEKSGGANVTKVSGDSLTAHFIAKNGVAELSSMHGLGRTVLEQIPATGIYQMSFGETLDAEFQLSARGKGAVELASAIQQGGVVMTRTVPAKKNSAASESQHATAGRVAYDAGADRLILTGSVQMNDAGSTVSANRVVFQQGSGDAAADGDVKVSYSQLGSPEPIHVLAERASFDHNAARATFYGSPATGSADLARMWQPGTGGKGGSQIEAPVLVFEQEQRRLTARAENQAVPNSVLAVFADTSSGRSTSASETGPSSEIKKPLRQGVARITSSQMIYSDTDRRAEFTGGVRLRDATGELRADEATVSLIPASASKGPRIQTLDATSTLAGLFGGNIDHIVASHHIEITQPGRRATGDRLIYTARDQTFVLTGTAGAPPKVVDSSRGTTTGAALRFQSGEDSVIVSGRDGDSSAQRVHTETQVR